MPKLRQFRAKDADVNAAQSFTADAVEAWLGSQWERGILTAELSGTGSAADYAHGLGRKPEGWILQSFKAASTADSVVQSTTEATEPTKYIKMIAPASSTFRLFIW